MGRFPHLFIFETTRDLTMKLGSVVLWEISSTKLTIELKIRMFRCQATKTIENCQNLAIVLTLFHMGYFLVILAWGGGVFRPPPNYLLNYMRYDNETWL